MKWDLQWGNPKQREVLEALRASGQRVLALENKPGLTRWTVSYYTAFLVLSDSRPIGFGGVGKIPVSEISAYCNMMEIDDVDERLRLTKMVQAMDAEYVDWMSKKNKSNTAENPAPAGGIHNKPRGRLARRR